MSRYIGARERFVQLDTALVAAAPARAAAPHLTVSPRTASGLYTGNLGIVLVDPHTGAAVPTGGVFDVTLYRAVPTLGEWGAFQTMEGVALRDQLVIADVSGGLGLYFVVGNVDTHGLLLVGVAEME